MMQGVGLSKLMGTFSTSNVCAARTVSLSPAGYRLKKLTSGEYILQGAFRWEEGHNSGVEWRDIETIVEGAE